MDNYNIHEKRTAEFIRKLSEALYSNDQKEIEALEADHQRIDFTKVGQPLLDQLDGIYNHDNYGREY